MSPVIEFIGVSKAFGAGPRRPKIQAVDGVSLKVDAGQCLALIGESGSGKSTIGRIMVGLLPQDTGSILWQGRTMEDSAKQNRRKYRWANRREFNPRRAMIFQDPAQSFNPLQTIGESLRLGLRAQKTGNRTEQIKLIEQVLVECGLRREIYGQLPRVVSGGQLQRASIARALLLKPNLIVADEPTSALDVSLRARILNLLNDVTKQQNIALLVVSHDLALVRQLANEVGIMYRGRIVERAQVAQLYDQPKHPYTQALLAAVPGNRATLTRPALQRVPEDHNGCPYAASCARAQARCVALNPVLQVLGPAEVACHYPGDLV